ncbi:MAG: CRISPR-associated endoribonuclease Cas6, partial [Proteobacteria bacterium]|nr:CRISPR-associated endoribonuclease Cas6 [Pseudomonadota bacterium]
MRLKVLLLCQKLNILYRNIFMALIKESLKRSDEAYKNSLYPDKSLNLEIVKPFTFSVLMPNDKVIKKEKFIIDERFEVEDSVFYFPEKNYITMYISSCDYEFVMNLYNGLLDIMKSNNNFLKPIKVLLINEKKIEKEEVCFKTLSPILIESKDNKPIL